MASNERFERPNKPLQPTRAAAPNDVTNGGGGPRG
jgi:hypothetical protein